MHLRYVVPTAVIAAFSIGLFVGFQLHHAKPSFHDMVVNWPQELPHLITPHDKSVHALAVELQTPENAYAFVRDKIVFDPSVPALPAADILAEGRASCLGKAILLCSIYRAMEIPADSVRVVTGELDYPGSVIDHAWLDMEYDGKDIQQDATGMLGFFDFEQFKGLEYTKAFIRKEGYVFNDKGFAIVSRLNQMKGTGHPPMH